MLSVLDWLESRFIFLRGDLVQFGGEGLFKSWSGVICLAAFVEHFDEGMVARLGHDWCHWSVADGALFGHVCLDGGHVAHNSAMVGRVVRTILCVHIFVHGFGIKGYVLHHRYIFEYS